MPTAEATLLAQAARAMREERERYSRPLPLEGHEGWIVVEQLTLFRVFDADTKEACRAWIDQRAFAAGLRKLAESEPTEAMNKAWFRQQKPSPDPVDDWRAMLGALLAGDEG